MNQSLLNLPNLLNLPIFGKLTKNYKFSEIHHNFNFSQNFIGFIWNRLQLNFWGVHHSEGVALYHDKNLSATVTHFCVFMVHRLVSF